MSLAVLDRGLGVAMVAVAADHPFAVPVPGGKKGVCVCVCVCVRERARVHMCACVWREGW